MVISLNILLWHKDVKSTRAVPNPPRLSAVVGGARLFGELVGRAALVDASVAAHAVEGFLEGFHHGVRQFFGLQFALALHGVAVHLEGQIVVDLPVDPGEDVGADVVIRRAVRDARHLEAVHGRRGLTPAVHVMQSYLERPDFQYGVARGDGVIMGHRRQLGVPQSLHSRLGAAGQEVSAGNRHLAKVGHLVKGKDTNRNIQTIAHMHK